LKSTIYEVSQYVVFSVPLLYFEGNSKGKGNLSSPEE